MTFRIDRGEARPMKGRLAKARIKRELHGLAIDVQGDRTVRELAAAVEQKAVMSWWNDLRRGHLPVYGALLRFIDMSVSVGAPKDKLLMIPRWIESYIHDAYDDPFLYRKQA